MAPTRRELLREQTYRELFDRPDITPDAEEAPVPSEAHPYLATAARLGGGVIGSVAGALSPVPGGAYLGGAAGGALGEAVGQYLNNEPPDLTEIGMQGALGLIPAVGRGGTLVRNALVRGGEAGAVGGISEIARSILHDREIDPETVARSALIAGGIGAVAGGVEHLFAGRAANRAQAGAETIKELSDQRSTLEQRAEQAYRQGKAQIAESLPVEERGVFDLYREGRISLTRRLPSGVEVPLDEAVLGRMEAAKKAWEDLTLTHENTLGKLPHQAGNDAAARVYGDLDPATAPPELIQRAESARTEAMVAAQKEQTRGRIVTQHNALDAARSAEDASRVKAGRIHDDATVVQKMLAEPTLDDIGLPSVGGTRMSASDPVRVMPSLRRDVASAESVEDIQNLVDGMTREGEFARSVTVARGGGLTPGKKTLEEIRAGAQPYLQQIADRAGTDVDAIVKELGEAGQAVTEERAKAILTVHGYAVDRFKEAMRAQALDPGSQDAQLELLASLHLARNTTGHSAGVGATGGRILRVIKEFKNSPGGQEAAAFDTLLKEAGTSKKLLDMIAAKGRDLGDDPLALSRFANSLRKATTADQIYEAWISGLLSSPTTHMVNSTSNALSLGLRIPEELIAGGIDAARSGVAALRGETFDRTRYAGEAFSDLYGMTQGLKGGFRAFLHTVATEQSTSRGKVDLPDRLPAIPGKIGRGIRLGPTFLLAEDDFFKTVGMEGKIRSLAYREAMKLKGKGSVAENIEKIIRTDRARLTAASMEEVLYRTFQAVSEKGQPKGPRWAKVPGAIIHMRDSTPGGRYVLPFVRTITNLMSFGLERTPVGFASLAAKGLRGSLKPGEGTDKLARALLGTGISAAVMAMINEGDITGAAPTGPGQEAAWRVAGKTPNSIRIGKTWMNYSRVEPLGMLLGPIVDARAAFNDPLVSPEDVVTRVAFGTAKRLLDQNFFTGIRQVFDAVHDPEVSGTRYLKRIAASAIPAGVAALARANDPVIHDTHNSLREMYAARLPGASSGLLPIRNVWGAPISREENGILSLLNPFERSKISSDPASLEVERLARVGFSAGPPTRAITVDGETIPLDEADYDTLSVRAGTLAHAAILAAVGSDGWERIDDEEKKDILSRKIGEARSIARREMQGKLAGRAARPPLRR